LVLLAQYTGVSRATLVAQLDHEGTLDIFAPEGTALEKNMSAAVSPENAAASPCSLSLLLLQKTQPLHLAHFRC
jgi:hypothetical protein